MYPKKNKAEENLTTDLRREGNVNVALVTVICSQDRECQQPPEAGRDKDSSLEPSERTRLCQHLISDTGLKNCERINVYCFKSPRL